MSTSPKYLLFSTINVHYTFKTNNGLDSTGCHPSAESKLSGEYKQWTAAQTAQQVLTNMEGDIRVEGDTIL